MKTSHSFSARLSAYIITAMTILSVGALASTYFYSRKSLLKDEVNIAQGNLQYLTSDIESVLNKVETAADNMVWVVKEHLDNPDYMYDITRNLILANEEIVGTTVAFIPDYYADKGEYWAPYSYIDPYDGKLKSIQMGNDEYHYFDMEWFAMPFGTGKSRWSEPYFDEGGGDQLMTTYSIPIRDNSNRIVAILTSDVSLYSLTKNISSVKLYKDSYTFILSRTGEYIAHPDSTKLLSTSIFDVAKELKSKKLEDLGTAMLNGESGTTDVRIQKGLYSVVYGPIKNGWSTCYLSPYSEVYSELRRQLLGAILVMILDMLLLFYLVFRIIKRTTQPITEFSYTALNIAKGNFDATIPEVKTNDEIKKLRDSLAFMVTSVKEYMKELQESTASRQRMESELNIASDIQTSMLAKDFPHTDDVDLYAMLKPAKEVGGDLYDFFLKDNKLYFAIGDVAGKGVPAALFMAITRSAFRFIASMKITQAEILSNINNAICNGNDMDMFVTMFIAKLDLDTGKMRFCNAGHNPLLIVHPDGRAEFLGAKANLAAGLIENFQYEDEYIELEEGSRLLLYTDGVTEAESVSKQLYGEDRLLNFAAGEDSSVSSQQFLEDLLSSVREFTAGNQQNDDITMLGVKYKFPKNV